MQKSNTIAHFSNFNLINNYYLLSQMYALAKFQPDMTLQSSNSKITDLYYKHCENKLQALGKIKLQALRKHSLLTNGELKLAPSCIP